MRNPRIHKLSYLLIDEKSWNRWSSKYLNYQNRLRSFEFITLFKNLGYTPELVDEHLVPENVGFLQQHAETLTHKYGVCNIRNVAITNFTLIARPMGVSKTEQGRY
jgi:hypothetical protein